MTAKDKQSPAFILCLDGGGVRGLSELLILQQIMEEVEARLDQPPPLPCELFDMMCGTGTGGLIALMLGRLRMSIDDCINAYRELTSVSFQPQAGWIKDPSGPAYNHEVLKAEVQKLVAKYTPTATTMKDPLKAGVCCTFVAATTKSYADAPPALFRTYPQFRPADRCEIWEAARATTAAPTFFAPIGVGIPPEIFIDAAYGLHNNPSELAAREVASLWRGRPIGLHLSLGAGAGKLVQMTGGPGKILEACVNLVTSCQATANNVNEHYNREYGRTDENPYHRISVDHGMEEIALDEWKRLDELTGITRGYLGKPAQEDRLSAIADALYARAKKILGV